MKGTITQYTADKKALLEAVVVSSPTVWAQ